MKNIFYNPAYSSLPDTMVKVAVFLVLSAILLWGIYFIVSKFKMARAGIRKELLLRHAFLWALVVFFILLNIYFFSLFYFVGSDFVNPLSYKFYLGLLPQLLIYLAVIVYFFMRRETLIHISKQKSVQ